MAGLDVLDRAAAKGEQLSLSSLREIGADLKRGVREPRIFLALLASLILWTAVYQHKRDYTVAVADWAYHPYIGGFNSIETSTTNPPFRYRWSGPTPAVYFPGIGNQPVEVSITTRGGRPGGDPPEVRWSARGQSFSLRTEVGERTDTFFLDRGPDPLEDDLRLQFEVPTFTPQGDQRELGVIIDRVTVRPADYGLRPPVIPPLATLSGLLAGLVGAYLLLIVCGIGRSTAVASAWVLGLLGAAGILLVRTDTALLAAGLPSLIAWTLAIALPARLASTLLDANKRLSPAVYLAFALAFLLRFGGLTFPQFLTSDIILHVNNVQDVMQGNWVFTEPLPDGRLQPYPPAYYLGIAALSPITGTSNDGLSSLFKWTASLLDALSCLALGWVAIRLWPGQGRLIGTLAAVAYLASPGVFDLFSAGNYTNLFAQSVLNLTLLIAAVYVSRTGRGRWMLAAVALGFFLTMMGHYGTMLAAGTIVGLFVVWLVAARIRGADVPARSAWAFVGAAAAALAISILLYYWRFTDVVWTQFADLLRKLGGGGEAPPAGAAVQPRLVDGLLKLPEKAVELLGAVLVVSSVAGSALLSRSQRAVRALLFAWLAAVVLFALLDRVVGDSIRWYYLGAVPLALLAGRFLAALYVRGKWSLLLATLAILAALFHMLVFWIQLIYTRYHG